VSTLSATRIAEYAHDAGFRGTALTTAVAVALAESGGKPKARGDTTITDGTWGPSIGLWQIRSLHEDRGTGGVRDAEANLDPATNARHAWSISDHGTNWQPWSAYTNGSYRAHLDTARAAAAKAEHNRGGGPQRHGGSHSASDRIVLDLHELRDLERFFDHGADRVRHVRRTIADVERDIEPARAALAEPALAVLITQTFAYLQSSLSTLAKAEERMDWHARFAGRVRKLAERADGDDGKWGRADALRFATSMGRADRAERAVLEALVVGTVVRRRAGLAAHLVHKGHAGQSGPVPVNTSNLRNGHVSAGKLSSVGDGEKLLGPAARQFNRMDAAAQTTGIDLHVNSGYRGYAEQAQLYTDYRNGTGNLAAPPGHSTHGLGLSTDINVTSAKTLSWLRHPRGRIRIRQRRIERAVALDLPAQLTKLMTEQERSCSLLRAHAPPAHLPTAMPWRRCARPGQA
jgi:lysozyme-like protein/D-alanyl-D-alanine carboxypeptidase-like protein